MNVGTSVPLPAYTIDVAYIARKAEEPPPRPWANYNRGKEVVAWKASSF